MTKSSCTNKNDLNQYHILTIPQLNHLLFIINNCLYINNHNYAAKAKIPYNFFTKHSIFNKNVCLSSLIYISLPKKKINIKNAKTPSCLNEIYRLLLKYYMCFLHLFQIINKNLMVAEEKNKKLVGLLQNIENKYTISVCFKNVVIKERNKNIKCTYTHF